MYLLNAEPQWRLFNTLEEYKKIRDQFLDAYTKCVATAQKSRPAMIGAPSQTPTHEPAANIPLQTVAVPTRLRRSKPGQRGQRSVSRRLSRWRRRECSKATYAPDPEYSDQARKARYQGTVVLWLVIDADGLPQNLKVQRSLGMGLDEEAIKAVKRWRFEPAMRNGQPVPVMINVEVNFRLYDSLAPHPASAGQPPRFPGVDTSEYPLLVRLNAVSFSGSGDASTAGYEAAITDAGQELQLSISCIMKSSHCLVLEVGTYPARWEENMKSLEILGQSKGKWKKTEYTLGSENR